jgi:hypothetical protein
VAAADPRRTIAEVAVVPYMGPIDPLK